MFHIASPVTLNDPSYDGYVQPVIQGTKSLVEGCKKHKIKKLIVTSSMATICGKFHKENGSTYDENDIAPLNENLDGYTDSKIHEEIILREFITEQQQL